MRKERSHQSKPYVLLLIVVLAMVFQYLRLSTLPTSVLMDISPSIYLPYILTAVIIVPSIFVMLFLIPTLLTITIVYNIPIKQKPIFLNYQKIVSMKRVVSQYKEHRIHLTVLRC